MFLDILLYRLYMKVESFDFSYMSSLVVISAGDIFSFMKEIRVVNIIFLEFVVIFL